MRGEKLGRAGGRYNAAHLAPRGPPICDSYWGVRGRYNLGY
jgi:hypothetical protein